RRARLESGESGAAGQVLSSDADRLRAIEGLIPVHGPGVVIEIDASGLTALDLQDALNNLAAGGAEAIDVNDHRVVMGVPVYQTSSGVPIGGATVSPPWTIPVIGDPNRPGPIAGLMAQPLPAHP